MTVNVKLKSVLILVAALGCGQISQTVSAQGTVNFSNTNRVSISSQTVGDEQMNLFFTTGNRSGKIAV